MRLPEEVFIVLSMSLVANMAYWQLTPFYPKFVREHGIDKEYVGFVMSAFAFMFIVSSIFTGSFLLRFLDRVKGCFIGALFVVS